MVSAFANSFASAFFPWNFSLLSPLWNIFPMLRFRSEDLLLLLVSVQAKWKNIYPRPGPMGYSEVDLIGSLKGYTNSLKRFGKHKGNT